MYNNLETNWKILFEHYEKNTKHNLSEFPKTGEIYPEVKNIFKCFNFFNIEDTKVVILGQDPYHTKNQATGLAFECADLKEQPSLRNIKKVLKKDKIDFEDWAKKGILLLNCSLTVEEGKAGSHMKFWLPFTEFVIDYISTKVPDVIFVCWGAFSRDICKKVPENQKLISSHPSPLSATKKLGNHVSFMDSDVFEKLKQKTGIEL